MKKFPFIKTKIKGVKEKFNLWEPKERERYFKRKAGKEIEKIKKYLRKNTFICYFLGRKLSGKGTYAKIFTQIIGEDKVVHLSVGDIVREVETFLRGKNKEKKKILNFLKERFRGYITLEEAITLILKRSVGKLLPNELILRLIEFKISKYPKKALLIDGFPRNFDQVSHSLFFRDLIGYRDDPDIFVFVYAPLSLINLRIKYRRICPICQAPKNLKLLRTKRIGYDKKKKEFYLICDRPQCKKAKLVRKEGDELGIRGILKRLKEDDRCFKLALSLEGIPQILLKSTIPVKSAQKYVDDYEISPSYIYRFNEEKNKIEIKEKPLIIKEEDGSLSYTLLPEAVVLSFIWQLSKILGLS